MKLAIVQYGCDSCIIAGIVVLREDSATLTSAIMKGGVHYALAETVGFEPTHRFPDLLV